MNKKEIMSIRLSKEEFDCLRQAASLQAYSSCSEFVRRTALLEARRVIKESDAEKHVYEREKK